MRVEDALRRAVDAGANAERIGSVLVTTWRLIDGALRPIIGRLGVMALYQRSIVLTARTHTWLQIAPKSDLITMDLELLRSGIAAQSPTDAAQAGNDMLCTFSTLLGSLVGTSLAERLLRPVTELNDDEETATGTYS